MRNDILHLLRCPGSALTYPCSATRLACPDGIDVRAARPPREIRELSRRVGPQREDEQAAGSDAITREDDRAPIRRHGRCHVVERSGEYRFLPGAIGVHPPDIEAVDVAGPVDGFSVWRPVGKAIIR